MGAIAKNGAIGIGGAMKMGKCVFVALDWDNRVFLVPVKDRVFQPCSHSGLRVNNQSGKIANTVGSHLQVGTIFNPQLPKAAERKGRSCKKYERWIRSLYRLLCSFFGMSVSPSYSESRVQLMALPRRRFFFPQLSAGGIVLFKAVQNHS
jgi:hypothetical protein